MMSIFTVIFLILLVLKLLGLIAISWTMVFLPVMIYVGLMVLVFGTALLIAGKMRRF